MSTYLLIHGAWHGAWCWEKIVPLLETAGHRVIAIDLPGHGEDQTPISEVTLDVYANRVVAAIDGLDQGVILVGHSMGGIVVSQAAEYRPNRIKSLVYLTAFRNRRRRFPLALGLLSYPSIQSSTQGY